MKMSAKDIGKVLGETAQGVNLLLKEKGYLDGEPGNYTLTELGEKFGEIYEYTNGWQGYAKRVRSSRLWDETIIERLKK